MPYLIDGHNLIPKTGLRLDNPDDEQALIARLQVFCRVNRKAVEVYFDQAPAGRAGITRYGQVTAHFIHISKTADDAIISRLQKLKGAAANYIVVTSDRKIQGEARACRATVVDSDEFARQIRAALDSPLSRSEPPAPGEDEIDYWLRQFGENPDRPKR